MKEIEELLAKLDDGDNQDIHEAILKAFDQKDKRIAELERRLKIACHVKADDKVKFDWAVLDKIDELEAQLKQANKSEISWLQAYQKKVRRLEAKLQKQSTIIKEARNENKKCYKTR
jgi:hypothetical protein